MAPTHPSKPPVAATVAAADDKKQPSQSNVDNNNNNKSSDFDFTQELSGFFRGIAAATRKMAIMARKTVAAKAAAAKTAAAKQAAAAKVSAKTAVRAVGENRPLAFASEGAVAGEPILPKAVYYGAWTLSGVAIVADIYNKYEDAPAARRWQTAAYWTCFHIPASLVVPALIIHQVVHQVQHVVENPAGLAKAWPPRAKAVAPVAAALLSIVPVVPAVDTAAEMIMEPTLGAYLGLEFHHHHGHGHGDDDDDDDAKAKKE